MTFTLAGFYSGDAPTNVSITDSLPANYAFVSASGTGWTCSNAGQTVECLRPGGAGTGADVALPPVTITATVVSAGNPVNSASIAAEGPVDPNPGNNTANDGGATIVDPTIDLAAIKVGPNPNLTVVGNSYTFRLRARNLGTAPFFGTVELRGHAACRAHRHLGRRHRLDLFAHPAACRAGLALLHASLYPGQPAQPGRGHTRRLVLEATATAPVAGTINAHRVLARRQPARPQPGQRHDERDDRGLAVADSTNVAVLKSALSPTIVAGDVQTFRIEVVNQGPQPATSVSLTDDLTNLVNDAVGPTGSASSAARSHRAAPLA